MRIFNPTTSRQLDAGLALLRTVTGVTFMAHGAQKLFVYGLDGVAGGFAQMGIPFPGVMGPFVGFLELFGGLALVAGLLTRLAGVGLAANMLGAMFLVHLKNGFFMPNGYEFVLMLAASAATLAITGAGRYSLDARIAPRRQPAVVRTQEPVKRAA
ncbi:MAG TPA: DoxX family protein [Gemmatimonadaceae bacterium]